MAAVKALKNGKAAGPDGLKAEDVKKMDPAELTKLMNDMIKNNDPKLKNGYLAPILKPGKDPFKPESYRPVTLLSVYRKILSRILLRRINPILDRETAKSQYAYRAERSTGDIVLVHKYLISAVKMKGLVKKCIGIDLSKAFDTVDRYKLLEILQKRGVGTENLSLIKRLLSNTTLQIKRGKNLGDEFETTRGIPQGDALSPRLFTLYLDEALREINEKLGEVSEQKSFIPLHGHDYARKSIPSSNLHVEFADDLDFICDVDVDTKKLVEIVKTVLSKFGLIVNEEKTEVFTYDDIKPNIKKLGTILDEKVELNKRKQLAAFAMSKYRKIWKNKFISTRHKVTIYNVYVRSIFLYNCSTWVANKTINNKLDSFHRRQLRQCLNIIYPKIIKNEELYRITKQPVISDYIAKRRIQHLGHILRRDTPTRDILHLVTTIKPMPNCTNPANLVKTYQKDLETPNLHTWITRALTRRL